MTSPIMIVIAGGNGSGKSTLYHKVIEKFNIPFLNADEYLKDQGIAQSKENTKLAQEKIREQCEESLWPSPIL